MVVSSWGAPDEELDENICACSELSKGWLFCKCKGAMLKRYLSNISFSQETLGSHKTGRSEEYNAKCSEDPVNIPWNYYKNSSNAFTTVWDEVVNMCTVAWQWWRSSS